MKIHVIENNNETTVNADPGGSLMEALRGANIEGIVAECGGSLACASCHVFVDDDWFAKTGEPEGMEHDMLDCTATDRKPGSRLSCQVKLTEALDGLRVTIPETQI